MRLRSSILSILACAAVLFTFGGVAQAANISGTVYESDGTTPVANVAVSAFFSSVGGDCGSFHQSTTTDGSGNYTLAVGNNSDYVLYADASVNPHSSDLGCTALIDSYYRADYGQTNDCTSADVISHGTVDNTGIDFRLPDGVIISGNISASTGGAPIVNAYVRFNTGSSCGGAWYGGRNTNSNGNYCLTVPDNATYYLEAQASHFTPQNYIDEWYDDQLDCSQANSVGVSGSNVTADFSLDTGASQSGTVRDSAGTPITGESILIDVFQDTGNGACGFLQWVTNTASNPADGSWQVVGLPGGSYYFRVQNMGGTNYVEEWFTGGNPDPSNIDCTQAAPIPMTPGVNGVGTDFRLDAGASVSGTVSFESGAPLGKSVQVGARTGDPCGYWNLVNSAFSDPDTGAYQIVGLPAGNYHVGTDNMSQVNYVNEFYSNGNPTPGDPSDPGCGNAVQFDLTTGGSAGSIDFDLIPGVQISGTVYESDGSTPISNIGVTAVPEGQDTCGYFGTVAWTSTQMTGEYTLMGLLPGNYFLLTDNAGVLPYSNEWHTGQTDPSDFQCGQAVTVSAPATDVDFELAQPGSISGTVTSAEDGTLLGNFPVDVYGGPCGQNWLGSTQTNPDGTYSIGGLPPGDLTVNAQVPSPQNYIDEWYDGATGAKLCEQAGTVTVTESTDTPNVDFALDEGPMRLDWFDTPTVNQDNNGLGVSFAIKGQFGHQLKQAQISMPNLARGTGGVYTYDLINDKISWDSECRYIIFHNAGFDTVIPADYGVYTLTLDFDVDGDGTADPDAQEVYTKSLAAPDVLSPVTGLSVTVNSDGSADVNWTIPGGQTDKFYRVRVRSLDGSMEYAATGFMWDTSSVTLSADKLRCLTMGGDYRWIVRVYDASWPFATAYVNTYVDQVYDPSFADVEKTGWVSVESRNGDLAIGFTTRSGELFENGSIGTGSRVLSATVTRLSDSFSHTFESADWFDLAAPTRLSLKGWDHTFSGDVVNDTYTFTIEYDLNGDGTADDVETFDRTVNFDTQPTVVDASTMVFTILPDGSIDFQWDNPAADQSNQVRVRTPDHSLEFYKGHAGWEGTQVTAGVNDLKGLQVGQEYIWFVRSYNGDGTVRMQSAPITFIYNPFFEADATGATFDAGSADIQNPYVKIGGNGDRLDFAGYGSFAGSGRYFQVEGTETLDSVACTKVLVRGHANHPDPDVDPEWYRVWVAEDTDGNVWALQVEATPGVNLLDGTVEDAALFMPANPQVGQTFWHFGGEYNQVQRLNVSLPELSTGAGPFTGCMEVTEGDDTIYRCANVGLVREEWDDNDLTNGWDVVPSADHRPPMVAWGDGELAMVFSDYGAGGNGIWSYKAGA